MANLDPRVRLFLLLFALIVCVTTPPEHFGAFAGYFIVAICAAAACRVSWRAVRQKLLILGPLLLAFALCIPFLPSHTGGGSYNAGLGAITHPRSGLMILWNVLSKGCFGVLAVTILTETTPFPVVLRALEQLHCPRLLVMLAGFVYRYAWVITDEVRRMRRAYECRMHRGRWLWQAGLFGRIIGMLFLRSYERGERVYLAMVSRGFQGQILSVPHTKLRARDWVFGGAAACIFVALRIAAL